MVKKWVGRDEWYPVYEIDEDTDGTTYHPWEHIEFTDEDVAELRDLFTRFHDWQEKLEERLEASRIVWEQANPEEHARKQKEWEEHLRKVRALTSTSPQAPSSE